MSRPKHYVIYIPGLGGAYDCGRSLALKTWRLYGVQAQLVPMKWNQERGYKPKYNRVASAVAAAIKQGYTVSLVADSAGASLALNVFADHPEIHRVVTLCGIDSSKIKLAETVKSHNPALDDSVKHLIRSLQTIDRERVISFRSRHDRVVAEEFSILKGAVNQQLSVTGHNRAIAFALTFGAHSIMRVLKNS